MAEDKKSFILYSDLIHTVEQMPNDKAGELFKHLLRYVNDLNPETDCLITNLTFEPIKQSLKRDLRKFEDAKKDRSEKGREGNLKRWNIDLYEKFKEGKLSLEEAEKIANHRKVSPPDSVAIKNIANIADNVSVNDSVSVNDILLEKETKDIFSFKKNLIAFGLNKDLVTDWLTIRKNKKASNTETAFKSIESEFLKCENELNIDRNTALKYAVESSWSGFKSQWIKEKETKPVQKNGITLASPIL